MPKNKIKTEWNLKLLYKSPKDPQIEEDLKMAEKFCNNFSKKYKNKDFTKNEDTLLKALTDNEEIILKLRGMHAFLYFHYIKELDSSNKLAVAMIAKITNRLTEASNKTIFFFLKLGKIPANQQKKYLVSKKLSHFKYSLERTFKFAKYNLSEPEEKILSLKSIPASDMWSSGYFKLLSKQTILWKGKELPIEKALSSAFSFQTKERRVIHNLIMEKLKSTSDFAEAEINAVYTDKKINDELRKYKNPYDSRLLRDEVDEKMVNSLVDTTTKLFSISHRFFKTKSKLLGEKRLRYADRGARIGKIQKKILFTDAVGIVGKAFGAMDKNFEKILSDYLLNGQIDAYPSKGKRGGAYCASDVNIPTFILMNYTNDMKALMTLAHEMGHGIHAEYTKKQPVIYQSHSTAVAEVASTFFEQVVFDNIFEKLSPKEQIIALHDNISDGISTIFRQIACYNFEKELHKEIRLKGFVSKEEIANLMNKHMKAYLGPLFDFDELDGYFFATWSHIRDFFYVYSYAYGELISRALYGKYKKDKKYIEKIKEFLTAGTSKSPYNIFKDIGIDTSDPNFWKEGLKEIEEDIKKLEKLAREAKMI